MRVVALAGGVGGAKLAHGLARVLPPTELTIIVNTADDFDHLGLRICPDLDTICYTLAGIANRKTGWGRADETWHTMESLAKIGGPDWFRLGDRDLAVHLERTRRLKSGDSLSQIVREFCKAWHIEHTILPMTDSIVATVVQTDVGELEFQEYFVHRRCEPRVRGFSFHGADSAPPTPAVTEALSEADVVILCPSNPWVSIGPILALPKLRGIIASRNTLAVSPIVHGRALKGPADKMYREMGIEPSALAVAVHYRGVISAFAADNSDAQLEPSIRKLGMRVLITNTVMRTERERARLARDVLDFALDRKK